MYFCVFVFLCIVFVLLYIQYLSVCSSFDLLYNELRHQQRLEYVPFSFRHSYNFDTQEFKTECNNP